MREGGGILWVVCAGGEQSWGIRAYGGMGISDRNVHLQDISVGDRRGCIIDLRHSRSCSSLNGNILRNISRPKHVFERTLVFLSTRMAEIRASADKLS